MRIAVIGSGIAGNAAAWALTVSSGHDVTLYEKDGRLGGHSATVDIDYDGTTLAVDTGFIVYNELNYPNLTRLFAHLGVETEASEMSFSVSAKGGAFEWSGQTAQGKVIDGLFARRRNLVSPSYLRMLTEILRFNRTVARHLHTGALEGLTLGQYLKKENYSARFRDDYLAPMGGAIWSTSAARMLDFPASSFVTFFENHRLIHWKRPVWRTVLGGSRRYVEKLSAAFAHRARMGHGVTSIRRDPFGVDVTDASGETLRYDQVVVAAHSDQALAILSDASDDERSILGAIGYRPNDVWLHRDTSFMPRRKAAWSAWNVMRSENETADVCVTYWMNVLQPQLGKDRPVFVTLNPPREPQADLVFGRYSYDHPQYDNAALAAQKRLDAIQGGNRTWFCGAWTGYGFHEDGLSSGLAVAERLGATVPWRMDPRRLTEAAE